jgi:hypothetical protein
MWHRGKLKFTLMPNPVSLRSWATPLTIGAFVLMATTGVTMFFRMDRGLIAVVHQWVSWLFLAGVGGHAVANSRPLLNHLNSAWGKASVAVFTVILTASFFSWGFITGPQLERPIERALVTAPLYALASVARTTPDALVLRLKAHGINATGQGSVQELAATSGRGTNRLLAIVFSVQ